LHAYVEGSAVEIMAASDNVARAGLTPKHVDVDTVLRLADTQPGEPQLVGARRVSAAEEAYDTPVPDFQLSRLRVPPGRPVAIDCAAPQVLLVVAGSGTIGQGAETIHVDKGYAVYADGTPIFLEGIRGEVVLFRATTTCRNDRDDAVGESS
jgi:mannose-6-phosphate isomerase